MGWAFGPEMLAAVSYSVFAAEFLTACLILAWALEVPLRRGILAAWIGALAAMPIIVPTPGMERLWGNPHLLTAISEAAIIYALFVQQGRRAVWINVLFLVAMLLLLAHVLISQPIVMVLLVPVVGFFGGGAMVFAARRERIWMAASVLSMVLLCSSAAPFFFGLFTFTKVTYFWNELSTISLNWRSASFLLEYPARRFGLVMWCMAVIGAIVSVVKDRGALRTTAGIYLCFVGLELGVAILFAYGIDAPWRGPTIAYIDLFAFPLTSFFAATTAYVFATRYLTVDFQKRAFGAIAVMPWLVLLFWTAPANGICSGIRCRLSGLRPEPR